MDSAGNKERAERDRDHASSLPGDEDPDAKGRKAAPDAAAKEVQPGTSAPGESWQSRSPDPDDKDDKLNQALKDSFPASDPPAPAQPGVTGWDKKDDE